MMYYLYDGFTSWIDDLLHKEARLTAQTMMRIQPLRAILVLAVCLGSILPSPGTASYLTTNQVVIGVTPDVLRAVPGITPESFLQIISGHFTSALGNSTGYSFQAISITYSEIFVAIEAATIDFLFTNAGIITCMQGEFDVVPIANWDLAVFGTEYPHVSGIIISRADRNLTKLSDIKNKIVATRPLSSLTGTQMQWLELLKDGRDLMNDPAMVQVYYDANQIITDVLAGKVDIGFLESGVIEAYIWFDQSGSLSMSNFTFINDKHPPSYPNPVCTEWAPFHGVVAMAHVPTPFQMSMGRAWIALTIDGPVGSYAQAYFVNPSNYNRVEVTLEQVGWLSAGTSANGFRRKCPRTETIYNAIACHPGYYKKSENITLGSCAQQGYTCPIGTDCVCKPCIKIPEVAYQVSVVAGSWDPNQHNEVDMHIAACQKMVSCGTFTVGQTLTLQVEDNLFGISPEESGGLAITSLEYNLRFDAESSNSWLPGMLGRNGHHSIILENMPLGTSLIAVRANGVQIADSPFVIELKLPNCIHPYHLVGQACKLPGINILAIVIPVLAGLLLIGAVAMIWIKKKTQRAEEAMWRIPSKDLVWDNPPVVLGYGAFGVVTKATYRGTAIAVKTILGKTDVRDECSSEGPQASKKSFHHSQIAVIVQSDLAVTPGLLKSKSPSSSVGLPKSQTKVRLANEFNLTASPGSAASLLAPSSPITTLSKHQALELEASGSKSRPAGSSMRGTLSMASVASRISRIFSGGLEASNFAKEIKMMVHLRHPNITTIMGACIDKKQGPPMLIMEYMDRGSLYDLIHNTTVELDSPMIFSILKDVVAGMRYLHLAQPPVLHLDVKSPNLLIDANFRTKVADFGLAGKKGKVGSPAWMSPEMLRGEVVTTAADVYSFAIVMYELYSRKDPYEGEDLEDVIRAVGRRTAGVTQEVASQKRPPIPASMPAALSELMQECWQDDPQKRPSFVEIEQRINRMDEGNMIDNLFARRDSMDSRHVKDNRLLNEVFPARIARQLREGIPVEPENYDVVTIFFSDIVGFTDISRQLAPAEVMNMLNRLYQEFDQVTRKHGLFKVETIGDAYMTVANLPEPQLDHAKRIAMFAFEVIAIANKVQVKLDDPSMGTINIRVGFHSGPVVASVVGSMNPRYCLFGDTVNTASRMESNSEKNRIHCSATAAALLREQAPEIKLTSRGIISIKGKGDMETFWVAGLHGIPDPTSSSTQ